MASCEGGLPGFTTTKSDQWPGVPAVLSGMKARSWSKMSTFRVHPGRFTSPSLVRGGVAGAGRDFFFFFGGGGNGEVLTLFASIIDSSSGFHPFQFGLS